MGFTWPGDKTPGRHTISWQQEQARQKGQPSNLGRGGLGLGINPNKPITYPAAAPAAAPAATPPPPDWRTDPTYTQALGTNKATYESTVQGIEGERTRGLQRYGYTAQFDPEGNLIKGTAQFDPTDPYSRAAMMKKNYETQRLTAANRTAAGGGLYSGAYQTGQDIVTRGQQAGEDQLTRSLIDYLGGTTQRIGAAKTTRATSDIDAATAAQTRAGNADY